MKYEQKKRFLELRARGLSYDKIARELKVSKQTLINWGKELGPVLDNVLRIEYETLEKEALMVRQMRLRFFKEQMLVIAEELMNRDMREVPTHKLNDMFLKYYKIIKEEEAALDINDTVLDRFVKPHKLKASIEAQLARFKKNKS